MPGPPAGERALGILAPLRAEGAKSVSIAVVSTVCSYPVVVVIVVKLLRCPCAQRFFNARSSPEPARDSAPLRHQRPGLPIAEAFILIVALFIAVLRASQGPVFFPIRALRIGLQTDLFRAVPTILVIYILGSVLLVCSAGRSRRRRSSGVSR